MRGTMSSPHAGVEAAEIEPREAAVEPSRASGRRRVIYEEAVAVIERSYGDDQLTVTGLSRDIYSSRRQVQRSFAAAGTSVRETLQAIRMERAAELRRESLLPVAEVASRVGYRQPAQFAKAFRRYHGVAPSVWRDRRADNLDAAA